MNVLFILRQYKFNEHVPLLSQEWCRFYFSSLFFALVHYAIPRLFPFLQLLVLESLLSVRCLSIRLRCSASTSGNQDSQEGYEVSLLLPVAFSLRIPNSVCPLDNKVSSLCLLVNRELLI